MARNVGVNFGGQYQVHPGAYSVLNSNAMGGINSGNQRRIIFLGTSESGQPGVVKYFNNLLDASAYLRSGDLLNACQLAWAPSGDGVGAGTIGVVRVTPATQATLTQASLTGTSIGYGATWNKIQGKLEDGTTVGTRKFTMFFYPDNVTEVYDNIGNIFSIQYTGDAVVAELNVTTDLTSGKATGLQVSTGATAGTLTVAYSYDFTGGQWQNIAQVVADLDSKSDITASMVSVGNHNIAPNALDAVTGQDIKAASFTVQALKGDFLFQTQYSQLSKFTFGSGAFPSNFTNFISFSGAVDGAIPTDWTTQFGLLAGEGADIIVPLSSSAGVHAQAQSFVLDQSNNERNEMMGFYGGALGETVDATVSRAIQLNSSRAVLCYPGITRQQTDGSTLSLPPYMTAAMVAGRVAGLSVGEGITLNPFDLIGLETVLKSVDVNRLIEAGVVVLEFYKNRTSQGYRSVMGLTTYQNDNNPVYCDLSVRLLSDDLLKDLRETLESKYVGKRGTVVSLSTLKNDVQSYLDQRVRDGWIVAYDPTSVTVMMSNDIVYVTFGAQPVESIDYILLTGNLYNLPITA